MNTRNIGYAIAYYEVFSRVSDDPGEMPMGDILDFCAGTADIEIDTIVCILKERVQNSINVPHKKRVLREMDTNEFKDYLNNKLQMCVV